MNNTRPEIRIDKNGHRVTRHVRVEEPRHGRTEKLMAEGIKSHQPIDAITLDPRSGQPYPAGFTRADIDYAVDGALETALFSSTHYDEDIEEDTPLDALITINDISEEERDKFEAKFLSFVSENEDLVKEALDRPGYDAAALGGDYWYGVNGHGTGAWDRAALEEGGLGRRLSEAMGRGEIVLYQGDDKEWYFSGV